MITREILLISEIILTYLLKLPKFYRSKVKLTLRNWSRHNWNVHK